MGGSIPQGSVSHFPKPWRPWLKVPPFPAKPPLFSFWLHFTALSSPLTWANSGPAGFRNTSCEQHRGGHVDALWKGSGSTEGWIVLSHFL